MLKISIITVSFNSASTIEETINSVLSQDYPNIEYIIVDGLSHDNTIDIVKKYANLFNGRLKFVHEKDKGIYDAMNKGILLATGDIIGILNSDDFFTNDSVISNVAQAFLDTLVKVVFGDIHFFTSNNSAKSIRKYSGKTFRPWMFRFGFMPPHPSFFVRKDLYDKFGVYDVSFDISGDYELMVRFLYVNKLKYRYLNVDMVAMRIGGASTKSIKTLIIDNNQNVIKACRSNGVYTNIIMVSTRYVQKILEIIFR